ncbi:hypothetical protein M2135_000001 [Parabacteroides sp. PF5-9]|nr:hypothetical protein [Parabacteroides sp. PF5-9]
MRKKEHFLQIRQKAVNKSGIHWLAESLPNMTG